MVPTPDTLKHRFTAEDYHRMAEAGILGEDDRVELIEGEIVDMAPIGRGHVACVMSLTHLMVAALDSRVRVSVQNPVHLAKDSEPQPDVVLLRRGPDYRRQDAGPENVLLIVEVADTSLAFDRGVKVPLYARAGIREVWIADVEAETVEVSRAPAAGRYQEASTFRRGERVVVAAFPDVTFAVDEIFG